MEAPLAATSFHGGAFKPRDNHRTSFREDIFKDGGSRHEPVLPLTPVAGLALLRRLSLDIREFEPDDSNRCKPPSASILAALYCQRAATLLEYADYDAAITLPAHVMSATARIETNQQQQQQQQQPEDIVNGNDSHLLVHAVSQALKDSTKASSLEPAAPEGYILAAQCARSTGDLSEASKMIRLAVDKAPPDTEIAQLAKEIALETSQVTHDKPSAFPALTTSTETIRFAEMSNDAYEHTTDERQHHGRSTDHSDNNDSDEAGTSHESWHRIVSEFEALKAVSESQHLVKMEQMMHHNVHHRCADQEQVCRLDEALKAVMSFLVLLVKCRHSLNVNVTDADEFEAIVKTKLERGDWHHSLIQDRTARKWMVEKLVTATRVSSHLISAADSSEDIPRVGVGFLRDALVLLARVLLSTGCWRLCTSMSHAMAYAEMSYDLVKELSASNSGSPPSSSSLSSVPGFAQLEMACSDAYGVALREMLGDHNEALSLHQESLETAVLLKSHAYELRCHHHIGQTLLHMKEPVLAQAEFMQLLVLSQAEGDAAMEALAQYELGQCCVQRGEFDEAQVHFRYAQTICNQTANCSGTWRPQSIQQAIAFYAVLRPARRRDAMRYMAPAAGARDRPRRAGVLYNESTLTFKGEVEPQDDQTDLEKQPTDSAIAKLFGASMGLSGVGDSMTASSTDSAGGAARKSRRRAGRRESVLAAPHSRAQLSRLASPVSSSSQFSCSPSVSPLSSCSTPSNEPSSVYGQHSNSSGTSSCGSLGTVLSYTGKLAMPADVTGEQGGHDTPVQADTGTYQASL